MKSLADRLCQIGHLGHRSTDGVELTEQSAQLPSHRFFDHDGLAQVLGGEHFALAHRVPVEVSQAAGLGHQFAQPGRSQGGRLGGCGSGGEDHPGIRSGDAALEAGEGFQRCGG